MSDGPQFAVAAKLAKSNEFLLLAEVSLELDAHDAAASLAVSAAINATDALVLQLRGSLPSAHDHRQAVTVVRRLGHSSIASQLARVLGVKQKAQYHVQRCTSQEAKDAVVRAGRLLSAVKEAI